MEKLIMIQAMVAFGTLFFLINSFIILPLTFNFLIIPRIEKRMNVKLEYTLGTYERVPGTKLWARYYEIAYYIFPQFVCSKFFSDSEKLTKHFNNNFALKKINFTVEQATRFEIFMSFYVILNMILFLGMLVAVGLRPDLFQPSA